MSKAKHTPGKWKLYEPGDYGDFDGRSRVILGANRRIAVVHVTPGDEETEANARLLFAAPEMLEVLKAVSGIIPPEATITRDRVLAVIAKVESPSGSET